MKDSMDSSLRVNAFDLDEGSLRFDAEGLIPAVVQNARTGQVLTLAYLNAESLQMTLKTGETWFYSRSRQRLWHKGETSGNTQTVVGIAADCDKDAVLISVESKGPACHTGASSCFDGRAPRVTTGFVEPETGGFTTAADTRQAESGDDRQRIGAGGESAADVLTRLEKRVSDRFHKRPEGAYTTYLFEKGLDKILKKVGEESAEVIIAAKNRKSDELRYEAADLLYHLLVLLREQELPLSQVLSELDARYAASER